MSDWRLFSLPWRERPWWSKRYTVINFSLLGIIALIVLWDALWHQGLGH